MVGREKVLEKRLDDVRTGYRCYHTCSSIYNNLSDGIVIVSDNSAMDSSEKYIIHYSISAIVAIL